MHIERATQVSDELIAALARLLRQLNASAPLPGRDELATITAAPGTYLLLARDPDIIGTLTLTVFRIPTGVQGQINNVIVDAAARGRGAGEALTREAIAIARAAGVSRLALTSRAARAAANRLYRRVGFELAETNPYRMTL
jgi:ribosomal protein S18 acetylase RimI-like enzyme